MQGARYYKNLDFSKPVGTKKRTGKSVSCGYGSDKSS